MWHGSMGEGGWMMGLGWVPMLIFWGLVLVAGVCLVRWLWGAGRHRPESDPALEELKARLARGEIDETEFNRLRVLITQIP